MIWQVTRSYRTNYALVQTLAVDHLNPLTNVSRTGTLTVAGSTTSPATSVTVDVTSATLYGDNSFARAGMVVTDGLDVYTAIAQDTCRRTDTNSVSVTLPSSVSFEHASKGTLTYDGYRRFTYDGLDRLRVVYSNGTLTYDGNRRFTYDNLDRLFVVYVTDSCKPFNRRRIRREYAWLNSGWSQFGEVRYVYDSNLVLCDGNGNVTLLTSSLLSTQRPVAKYIYDSFGNLITMSGPLAEANTCRFSSKDLHTNSGFHCFGRRFYDPNLQRWPSRDPIGEKGGLNLYGFVGNNPVTSIDRLGRDVYKIKVPGFPMLDHRQVVGDDGKGNAYLIDFGPEGEWCKRLCGRGKYGTPQLLMNQTAEAYIKGQGSNATIARKVKTSKEVDATMAKEAMDFGNKDAPLYIFLWNDCGTFANRWLDRVEATQKAYDEAIRKRMEESLPPLPIVVDPLLPPITSF